MQKLSIKAENIQSQQWTQSQQEFTIKINCNNLGFYRWMGDQREDNCRSCLNETVVELQQQCPSYKEAIGWSECCTARCSNQQLYGSMKGSPFAIISHVNNTSHVDGFNQALSSLLTNLSSRAAAEGSLRKYAVDKVMGPGSPLTATGRSDACRVLQPSCNLRYETDVFFAAIDDIPQPSPLPSSPQRTGAADGLITAESLQYDLATVRAATKNFCEENKLEQGGFGAFYKGKLPHGQDIYSRKKAIQGF
ncbi:hypothetical protein SLEP1_g45399 [Rubroshorea leprosula]|uniref:Gnk2-homologous domain-containing protein n=1 Tax=Rubroshorea leprosula TaxID=152421 RepID=A0AAV5LL54_9ROSI|nr:hypothetical protein SLEP1_g45399 [Rubroshorea leprosula]